MEIDDIETLIKTGKFTNPHAFLGLNRHDDGELYIRLWRPESHSCQVKIEDGTIRFTLSE